MKKIHEIDETGNNTFNQTNTSEVIIRHEYYFMIIIIIKLKFD